MRFHVVSLPHTQTTKEFVNCAYTEKVRRFCNMMKSLGHEVYLYAGEQNEAEVTELIPCITEEQRVKSLNGQHFTSGSFDYRRPHWMLFNANVVREMQKRIQQKDFICLIGGHAHKIIADSFPNHISVEFGVGYSGVFSPYKVFESYSWMHSIYAQNKDASASDGAFFDRVIPGYLDPEMFPLVEKKDDYYLFIGRLIDRKGYHIAQQVCQELGKRLIVAGPGDFKGYGEYVGPVGPEERAKLMGNAIATFVPTLYIEPFGNVNIESQACGTPVITTDWGAFTETVEHGKTGFRCRTFQEFCEAAEAVKTLDPVYIRNRAISLYSVDIVKYQYERYFQDLLKLWGKGWYERDIRTYQMV